MIGEILLVSVCLAIGGILKGATGAGTPILAVPAIAALFDVRFAIVVMVVPNVVTNAWQAWRFRESLPVSRFTIPLVAGGIGGVCAGTFLLSIVPAQKLSILVAFSVTGYVALRLARPGWKLSMARAKHLALPAGLAAGFLQGASGLSAPVSLTFLNAMRLDRSTFIAIISLFFTTFGFAQMLALMGSHLLSASDMALSVLALIPIWAGMPLGSRLARHISPQVFDRFILALLITFSLKLTLDVLL
jgi:uncharacterized membrane protein YfcA